MEWLSWCVAVGKDDEDGPINSQSHNAWLVVRESKHKLPRCRGCRS